MADEVRAVEFVAEIRRVMTLSDHTVNVTLNLPEYCLSQAAWYLQNQGSMIHGVVELRSDNGRNQNESKAGQNY